MTVTREGWKRFINGQQVQWCRGCGMYHGWTYACCNQDARPQHPEPVADVEQPFIQRTTPPTLDNHQHHWLDSERASWPSVAEWLDGKWRCVNEAGPVTPEEMWRRGWRWRARAVPPAEAGVAPSLAPTTTRPSWDETWMSVVAVMACRSTCARRAVGCVIVDRSNNFLSEGFNGVESGAPHCNEGHPCPAHGAPSGTNLDNCLATHAEQNALVTCGRPWAAHSLYVSVSPCISCLKLVTRTRIQRIVFAEEYAGSAEARERWLVKPSREWVQLPHQVTPALRTYSPEDRWPFVDAACNYVTKPGDTVTPRSIANLDCQNERPR